MNPQKCYEENIDNIKSISNKNIVKLTMPQEIVASEGHELKIVLNEDIEALTARGLNPQISEELSKKIAAFTYAAALCELDGQNESDTRLKWDAKKEEGYALKKKIIHEMEFAFSDNPEALSKLAEVKNGKGHRDMLIDLLELEIVGREYSDLLTKTLFDFTLLDRAKTLHEEVTKAYADMRVHGRQTNETIIIRDKAYTWLKETMDEIRKYGKFVFSNDPNRFKLYKSEYYQELRSRSNVEKIESNVNENDTN